jgi:hypothetical protein
MFTKMDKNGLTFIHDTMIPGDGFIVTDTDFFKSKKFFEDNVFGSDKFGWS